MVATRSYGICGICGKECISKKLTVGELVRPTLLEFIQGKTPSFTQDKLICTSCMDIHRSEYIRSLLQEDHRKISTLEKEVIESIKEHETLAENPVEEFEGELSWGDRLSDKIAEFGGSWTFITFFFGILMVWIVINFIFLSNRGFDPYPFILLNLCLSCLAAIQAPIIMMSQNRQEDRDRARARSDYQINLKAELEIQHLNEKIDMLLKHQWKNLIQIQQIQMDILEEIRERK